MPGHHYKVSRNWQASIEIAICAAVLGSLFCRSLAADTAITPTASSHFSPVDEAKIRAAGIRRWKAIASSCTPIWPKPPTSTNYRKSSIRRSICGASISTSIPPSMPTGKCGHALSTILPASPPPVSSRPIFPNFFNGYTRDYECWLNNQTSPYYRRHLLLHEGVHGIMFTLLGDHAPAVVHRRHGRTVGNAPLAKRQIGIALFSQTGRRSPQARTHRNRPKRFHPASCQTAGRRAGLRQPSAPESRTLRLVLGRLRIFRWPSAIPRSLSPIVASAEKQRRFQRQTFASIRRRYRPPRGRMASLRRRFRLRLRFHPHRNRFFARRTHWPPNPLIFRSRPTTAGKIPASCCERGKTYKLTATGKYQVANDPKPWISEPGGVSIRYIHGRPLGQLLAAVHPDRSTTHAVSAFLKPIVVGNETTITPTETGTLYFQINDSSGELSDNSGHADVTITAN